MNGLIKPVEEAPLNLVGKPAPVGSPEGTLLCDEDVVRLLDALADGVPVDAGAIKPAKVDDVRVDGVDLVEGLEHVVGHGEVTDDGDVVAGATKSCFSDGQVVVVVLDGTHSGTGVEVDVLENDNGVVACQCGIHQPHVVERI